MLLLLLGVRVSVVVVITGAAPVVASAAAAAATTVASAATASSAARSDSGLRLPALILGMTGNTAIQAATFFLAACAFGLVEPADREVELGVDRIQVHRLA